jgi:hypothetical protein
MLSTEINFAPGLCPVGVRCNPRGGESLESVIKTVGPLLLFAVGPLIVLALDRPSLGRVRRLLECRKVGAIGASKGNLQENQEPWRTTICFSSLCGICRVIPSSSFVLSIESSAAVHVIERKGHRPINAACMRRSSAYQRCTPSIDIFQVSSSNNIV